MKVIIDTDMLIDDWMAILYLLQNKDVEVIGIAVTGTGGSYLEPGCQNALSLLKITGLDTTVPVCSGAEGKMGAMKLYFLENLDRLMSVKRKWDPNDFFNSEQSIPLK